MDSGVAGGRRPAPPVRRAQALRATLALLLLAAGGLTILPVLAQTMDRSAGGMTMRPSGPGGMWTAVERDGSAGSRGQRLFRAGRLPGDRTAEAERAGNPVGPDQVACANCHGRSGQGVREGGQDAPPIHAGALFSARSGERARPSYDDAGLARAIREGIGADGQPLSLLMPRYRLAADDMAALVDYLHGLRMAAAGGVSAQEVRLATVIAGEVPASRQSALLATLQAYVADVAQRRGGAVRAWTLDTWMLSGSPAERRAQLEEHQARQPVAAIVGGLGDDSWLAVHQFCEQHAVPCLFPDTGLPPADQASFYSVYLDKGRSMSGQLLARYLKDHPELLEHGPLLQVMPADWEGYLPASALRGYLGRAGARRVHDLTLAAGQVPDEAFWRDVLAREHPAALALWAPAADLAPLAAALAGQPALPVFRPAEDLAGVASMPVGPADGRGLELRVLSRLLPEPAASAAPAWREFVARHGVPEGQEALCADTWFAARMLDDALADQPGPVLDVDRVMTRIEYAAGTVVVHPLRPDLALGMGQRFAGKSGWLLQPMAGQARLHVSGTAISP